MRLGPDRAGVRGTRHHRRGHRCGGGWRGRIGLAYPRLCADSPRAQRRRDRRGTECLYGVEKDGSFSGSETLSLDRDEGIRADTTAEGLARLKPVWRDGTVVKEGRFVTAGNASQLSDGASAKVLMDRATAEAEGLPILGIYRGFQSAGCAPEEMDIGPVFAIPKLLARAGLTVDDVGLWEINEAFASQFLYCRDRLGIDPEKINVDGGGIALGHPFGMTGSRLAGRALIEAKGREVRHAVVSMCVASGMGSAGLFEIP